MTEERVKAFWRDRERRKRKSEEIVEQKVQQKLVLLFRHYGIPKGDTAALARALALEHVPGFKIVPESRSKGGRKRCRMAKS